MDQTADDAGVQQGESETMRQVTLTPSTPTLPTSRRCRDCMLSSTTRQVSMGLNIEMMHALRGVDSQRIDSILRLHRGLDTLKSRVTKRLTLADMRKTNAF
jgi:hypothetical protein